MADRSCLKTCLSFSRRPRQVKRDLLRFLIQAKEEGKSIAGYGAAAKGNTLLNYCGVRTDFIDYTVDRSPHKQGRYLPGTRIPIHAPDRLRETHFSVVLSDEEGNQLYIPKGMAHGFQTLEDATEVFYQISEPYVPQSSRGYRWDDHAFAIPWPEPVAVISEKDRQLPFFSSLAG